MKDAFQSGLWGYNSMFEEENKGFIEKMKDFLWTLLFNVVLCVIIGLVAYLLVGCAKKPSVETNCEKKESVEVQNLVINNDVESTSSKNKKAKSLSVPILSEDDFIEKYLGGESN